MIMPLTAPASTLLDQVEKLPNSPGIYCFYSDNSTLLYVGKSMRLRDQVRSYFYSQDSMKIQRLVQQIKYIDWIETAGKIGALLKEAELIKNEMPLYNRKLKKQRMLYGLKLTNHLEYQQQVTVVPVKPENLTHLQQYYGVFNSQKEAHLMLHRLAEEHGFCPRLLGLQQGRGPCFAWQFKRCRGGCVGKEGSLHHYYRLLASLIAWQIKLWPFPGVIALQESTSSQRKPDIHLIDQWRHLGVVNSQLAINDMLQKSKKTVFDLDIYNILARHLIPLPSHLIISHL